MRLDICMVRPPAFQFKPEAAVFRRLATKEFWNEKGPDLAVDVVIGVPLCSIFALLVGQITGYLSWQLYASAALALVSIVGVAEFVRIERRRHTDGLKPPDRPNTGDELRKMLRDCAAKLRTCAGSSNYNAEILASCELVSAACGASEGKKYCSAIDRNRGLPDAAAAYLEGLSVRSNLESLARNDEFFD